MDFIEALATYQELVVNNPNIYDSRIASLTTALSEIGNIKINIFRQR
jgi:hypothetical protein